MPIITFLTDFGLTDNFVGVMKAVILSINPQAQIIDISHSIPAQDIRSGAVLLKYSYKYFSPGTIHLVVVDPGVGSNRKPIIVKTRNYIFIAPDNGIVYPSVCEDKIVKIIHITNDRYFLAPVSNTFHGRDIFSPVAGFVSKGESLEKFGNKITRINRFTLPAPRESVGVLTGEVIYIDRFGNLITNISQDEFYRFIQGKSFKLRINKKIITRLASSYIQRSQQRPLCIFGSFGNLEISLNRKSAQDYLRVKPGTKVELIRL